MFTDLLRYHVKVLHIIQYLTFINHFPLSEDTPCGQVEHERVRMLEQQKDDLQFSLEEKVRKVDAAHSKILQDTLAAYDQ